MRAVSLSPTLFRRTIALPSEHGAWVFLLSPLLIGLAVGGRWTLATTWLVVAALAVFLLRQPVSYLVKVLSGRRPTSDLPSAIFWCAVYGSLGLGAASGLWWLGFGFLFYLVLPAALVFVWHLWLISRRAERRQMLVEIVGSGILALAAPAAVWVAQGAPSWVGWELWALTWAQSAASIIYAYLRLAQRTLPVYPPVAERWRMGRWALLATAGNMVAAGLLSGLQLAPVALALPYALQFLETVWGTLQPAVGLRPVRIGLRQLLVSSLFTLLFMGVWWL